MTEASIEAMPPPRPLAKLSFGELAGFAEDDHAEAFAVFQRSCALIVADRSPQAICAISGLQGRFAAALWRKTSRVRRRGAFSRRNFRPFRATALPGGESEGFFTGYYEPVVEGSLTRTDRLHRAHSLAPERSDVTGSLSRPRAIEAGAIESQAAPIIWLRDPVEVFLIQVQGSARVCALRTAGFCVSSMPDAMATPIRQSGAF